MTQEENITIHRMVRESYDDWWGEIEKFDPLEVIEFRRGYISGYANLFVKILRKCNLNIKLLCEKLEQ